MVTFGLVEEAAVRRTICARRGIPYHDGIRVYLAMEEASLLGSCMFTLSDILYCEMENPHLWLQDGFLKAVTAYLRARNAPSLDCPDGVFDAPLLKGLGFREAGAGWRLDLRNRAGAGCGGQKST